MIQRALEIARDYRIWQRRLTKEEFRLHFGPLNAEKLEDCMAEKIADICLVIEGEMTKGAGNAVAEQWLRITPDVVRRINILAGYGKVHRHHIETAVAESGEGISTVF